MNNNQRLIIILLFFISVCIICFAVYLIIDTNDNPQPTQPTTIDPVISIANTSSAAQTQTAILITIDSTPSISEFPTSFTQPTLAPTWTPAPTDTPFILTLVTVPASNQSDQNNQCSCTADTFNCGDALAETCFIYCNSQGYGDIHRLDQDGDGIACEDN